MNIADAVAALDALCLAALAAGWLDSEPATRKTKLYGLAVVAASVARLATAWAAEAACRKDVWLAGVM